MPWKKTKFDRATLYEEVWTSPVIHVAKRYEVSDVGLRKICKRLGVPLPPVGYWARKAAGQKLRTVPLPKWTGPTSYESSRFLDNSPATEMNEVEEAFEVIKQRAFEADPRNQIVVKDDLLGCHRLVTETSRKIQKSSVVHRGLVHVGGGSHLSIEVSPDQVDRALRIWSALLKGAEERGFKLLLTKRYDVPQSTSDVMIDVHGEPMYVTLTERVRQKERELTPHEKRIQLEDPKAWIAGRLIFTPTGIFKLIVKSEFRGYTITTLVDKKEQPIEDRLNDLMVTLVQAAMTRKAARIAREVERRNQIERELEERRLREIRENNLTALNRVESLATRWERAERLRRFASELEERTKGTESNSARNQIEAQVKWIRRAADWLDPLICADWPEVDAVGPGYNYHQDWMKSFIDYEGKGVDDFLRLSDESEDK